MRDPSRNALTVSSSFLLLALCICGINGLLAGDSQGDPYMTKSPGVSSSAGRSAASFAASPGGGSLNNDMSTSAGSQAGSNKFLPDGISRTDKLRAFLECRKECIAKCDRLVYVYSTKKEFCHDCIRQCMVAVLQQARSLGIEFSSLEERMQGDSPDDDPTTVASGSGGDRRGRRNRRNHRNNRDRKGRRERRQRKEQQQKLLKNCIVH